MLNDVQPNESLDAVHEAKLMQKLEHPCIVKFYESFLDGEQFCIVSEFCDGGDLDVFLARLRKTGNFLDEDQILTWLVELVSAVMYIHSRGVLHRDIKTRNIFIHDKMLKLGDFGISRVLMSTSDMASTFVGTPYYMSPEVLKHDGYNSKSDIWSIGCILIEMCTLERAFEGTNIMNVMWNIMQKEVPRIPKRYSDDLQQVANRYIP
jgi:NIMA (never in mitosis gene a)-related kinase 11